MRLLTGKHRRAYESLVEQNGRLLAKCEMLEEMRTMYHEWVQRLITALEHERKRAERAIDAQLAVRGFPTVTPRDGMPDIPDGLDEDPEKVAELEKRLLQGDATVFTEPR